VLVAQLRVLPLAAIHVEAPALREMLAELHTIHYSNMHTYIHPDAEARVRSPRKLRKCNNSTYSSPTHSEQLRAPVHGPSMGADYLSNSTTLSKYRQAGLTQQMTESQNVRGWKGPLWVI